MQCLILIESSSKALSNITYHVTTISTQHCIYINLHSILHQNHSLLYNFFTSNNKFFPFSLDKNVTLCNSCRSPKSRNRYRYQQCHYIKPILSSQKVSQVSVIYWTILDEGSWSIWKNICRIISHSLSRL